MRHRFALRWLGALSLLLTLALPSALDAQGSTNGTDGKTSHAKAEKAPKTATSRKSTAAVPRRSNGKIRRSAAAKHRFEVQTGYPKGRPGYVVDHIIPLACGGADAPSNMQWQTVAAARAKDKVERKGC